MQHRLTLSQKEELCHRYQSGETTPDLADYYQVSVPAICGLLDRRNVKRRSRKECGATCTLNHDAFAKLTPEACYWIGFLFADGTIVRRSGSPEIAIVLGDTDRSHLERFRQFLGSTHAITYIQPNSTGFGNGANHRFSFRSERIADRLTQLGMVGSLDRSPSPLLQKSSHFWRGVVDGDGCIGLLSGKRHHVSRIELVGGRVLLEQFVVYVKTVCPDANLTVRPHKSIYRVGTSGKNAKIIIEALYSQMAVGLERKTNAAINILRLALG